MKRYDSYLKTLELLFILAFFSFCFGIVGIVYFLALFAILQTVIGLMQLTTGIIFLVRAKREPVWFAKGMYWYWGISVLYFIVLAMIYHARDIEDWQYLTWLFLVPWFIAFYQYILVGRLKCDLEARQERNMAVFRSEWESGLSNEAKKI